MSNGSSEPSIPNYRLKLALSLPMARAVSLGVAAYRPEPPDDEWVEKAEGWLRR
jgi:hypothetical protein